MSFHGVISIAHEKALTNFCIAIRLVVQRFQKLTQRTLSCSMRKNVILFWQVCLILIL
ncbi:hypothetical protein OESDEN_11761 [Oesophagostomum dentatum]|uniref:Uncharacterized protein n=1 Tax=Oesophagostomum dentatum TaxID=61180 RepID=A0A0B1SU01_OESDE|nr:hypothetical protein OESDEN_11761 [Oesophagostomum dentatum]